MIHVPQYDGNSTQAGIDAACDALDRNISSGLLM